MDRDYMRSLMRAGRSSWNGSGWPKYLWIAAVVIGLATAGLYLYKNIRAELLLGEGDLIVNVNNATQAELETIPGIGPAFSRQIIAGRPYARIEDLERVRGISRYTVNSIRPYAKVQGETEKR
jgi:hypothetical protein